MLSKACVVGCLLCPLGCLVRFGGIVLRREDWGTSGLIVMAGSVVCLSVSGDVLGMLNMVAARPRSHITCMSLLHPCMQLIVLDAPVSTSKPVTTILQSPTLQIFPTFCC